MSPSSTPFTIKLQVFEGPLDLLLHLIKQNQVDIYDIPIALITEQYVEYLELMTQLNLDFASEFLVMAATLIEIKSRMLLPVIPDPEGQINQQTDDPREELVQRLLEYQKFKEAALALRKHEGHQAEVFTRIEDDSTESEKDLFLDVSMFDLLEAFRRLLQEKAPEQIREITRDEILLTDKLNYILEQLEKRGGKLSFLSLTEGMNHKLELIVTFLALLELVHHRLIKLRQSRPFGQIWIWKDESAASQGHN